MNIKRAFWALSGGSPSEEQIRLPILRPVSREVIDAWSFPTQVPKYGRDGGWNVAGWKATVTRKLRSTGWGLRAREIWTSRQEKWLSNSLSIRDGGGVFQGPGQGFQGCDSGTRGTPLPPVPAYLHP